MSAKQQGEPKQSTMTKTNNKQAQTKESPYLFSSEKVEWKKVKEQSKNTTKVNLGDTNTGLDMAYYFHELDGTKQPEMFLLWLTTYCNNVLKATNVMTTAKIECIFQLLIGEAKSLVMRW